MKGLNVAQKDSAQPPSEPAQLAQVRELLAQLSTILGPGVGTRSKWALRAAADAAETEGIGGLMVILIPPRKRDHVDITFTIGQVEVVSRWANGA